MSEPYLPKTGMREDQSGSRVSGCRDHGSETAETAGTAGRTVVKGRGVRVRGEGSPFRISIVMNSPTRTRCSFYDDMTTHA